MKEPLFNLNIETTILASLIFNDTLLKTYHKKIHKDMFHLPCNRKIFEIILDLDINGKNIDEHIISEKLGNECEDAFLNILSSTPMANIEAYLEVLLDYGIKRELQNLVLTIGNDIEMYSGQELYAKLQTLSQNSLINETGTIFQIENIQKIESKDVDFICKDWLPIPKRTVSIIASPGGVGKSWMILQLAIRAVKNKDVNKAFLWLSEDPKEITKNRFNKIKNDLLKFNDSFINDNIDISDSPTIQIIYEEQRKSKVSPLFYQFKAMLDKYDLIILDPLIAFYGADENNNADARQFMQLFTHWANKENKTIIFIHHSTKNTTQSRGASAFVDAVRIVYEVDKLKNKDGETIESSQREVKLTKDNYGASKYLDKLVFKRDLFPKKIEKQTQIHYEYKDF